MPSRTQRARERDADAPRFGATPQSADDTKWDWNEHVSTKPEDSFVPYTPKTSYSKAALITHPTFGKGIITAVEKGKIEVLFKEGAKKLVHAG